MGMLRIFTLGISPGMAVQGLTRYTSINARRAVLNRVTHPDMKYWTTKYLDVNDMILSQGEKLVRRSKSLVKKEKKK